MSRSKGFPYAAEYAASWSVTLAIVFGLLMVLGIGCGVPSGYVAEDRKFFDLVIPRYVKYTEDDPLLTDEVKARRIRTTVAKDAAITQAERP